MTTSISLAPARVALAVTLALGAFGAVGISGVQAQTAAAAGNASAGAVTSYAGVNTIDIVDIATLTERCKSGLGELKSLEAGLVALAAELGKTADAETWLNRWDDFNIAMEVVQNGPGFLGQVHPDKALRTAAEACDVSIGQYESQVFQNAALYKAFQWVQTQTAKPLSPEQAKFVKDALFNFVNTGVALPQAQRERVKAIRDRLEEVVMEYQRNIRDNSKKLTFTAAEVKGMPADVLARAKRDEQGQYLLGFDYPEYIPLMEYAEDAAVRQRMQKAYTNRGGEKNLVLIKEALTLRQELAELLGAKTYAEQATKRRMAQTPEAVNKFLGEVKAAVTQGEKAELEEMRQFKAKTLNTPLDKTVIERWDATYWQTKLKRAKYAFDDQQMRAYFPAEASLDWVMGLASTLYGIEFKRGDVPVWHSDVRFFNVMDKASGAKLGGLYIDLYPREGKYGHAAVWGLHGSATRVGRTPMAALVTNLDRKGLNGEELRTLTHEFGHAMHGMLSRTRYSVQAGTSVERDFVEAPSQMFEEWARQPESLNLLANHCKPECPRLNNALLDRMRSAHNYGRGLRYGRQWLYAAYDMALYGHPGSDPMKVWADMEGATPLGYVPGTEFPGQFGHIVGGYAAGYYGYMWSEVMALDMLNAFGGNLMNPKVGMQFRTKVLASGSSKPSAELVRDFLGREPNAKAFYAEMAGTRLKALTK